MGPATIHLVRHASHGLLDRRLAGRMPGVGLDAAGRGQARELAARFAGQAIAAVISSPIQRAVETAEPIAARLGLAIAHEPDLAEVDFGRWTGLRFEELHADPAWAAWNRLRGLAGCPGGETMQQVQARALLAMARLARRADGGVVIAVTHGDVIKSVLAAVIGFPLDHLQRIEVAPASVSTVTIGADFARAERVNG